MWGFIGIPLYGAAYLLAAYGTINTNSSAQSLLCMPVFVQEMVLAIWTIARGFRPAALSATSELASASPVGAKS